MKKIIPYLAASLGFILTVVLITILLDSVIFPSLIHDKDKIKVPDLIGKNITEVEKIIFENELTIGKLNEQFNEKIPQGVVINQIPKAGAEVKAGRAVHLSISKGKEMVRVPYIVGQNIRTARISLKNAGLEVGDVKFEFSNLFGADTVASQLVSSGRNVPYGTPVDIVVSKGSENQVKVPNIIGKNFDDAKAILEESGLLIGNVASKFHETYLPNTVISQIPAPGELAVKGNAVDIVISQ
jgi:serine/threonine-protein kinase